MKKSILNDANLMMVLVAAVGLVFCSLLFFRVDLSGDLAGPEETVEAYVEGAAAGVLGDAVRLVAAEAVGTDSYAQPAAPMPSPDAITAATPRIIGWVGSIVNRTKPAVVGICAGDTNQPPPWQQGWEIVTPAGRRSVGSGIIVDPRGYVVTNYHVVSLAGSVVVSVFDTHGEKDYPATMVAGNEQCDLALLRIRDPGGAVFPCASLGDSSKVAVGDRVIAVGNPFGLTQTATSGIISARRQRLPIGGIVLHDVFQTDVPINPGNSGGALLDLNGKVIGVNTAIYSPVESVFTGVSFAIPINQARKLFAGFLGGAEPAPAGGGQAAAFAVVPRNPLNCYRYVAGTPGASSLDGPIQPSPGEGIEELAWLGIDVVPSDDANVPQSEVLVDEIEGISPMEAGLEAGDIVRAVNGTPTPNIYAFKEAIKRVPLKVGQGVMLDVHRPRSGETLFIGFRLKKWDILGR